MRQTSKRPALGLVARLFYILWFILWALAFWGGLAFNDLPSPEFFGWYAAALFGGWVMIFTVLTLFSFLIESETWRSWFVYGRGGSARWSGSLDYLKLQLKSFFRKAPIYLGRTKHKYDPWPWCRDLFIDDEAHMVTMAMTRSGKSTTVIWPNLVTHPYPFSAFILDPKGEHAIFTSVSRYNQGQSVYVLDPFNQTKDKVKRHSFNPLSEIDPQSGRAKEDIKKIAEACFIESDYSSESSDHFKDLSRAMIVGVIAHVLTTEASDKHNLPAVYDYFFTMNDPEKFKAFMEAMRHNSACGNAPANAYAMYTKASPNEKSGIITTVLRMIDWIASDDMRAHLSQSDFTLAELKTRPTILYVCLDFDDMKPDMQGRYMRVLLNLALHKAYTTPLPDRYEHKGRRVLFILDEVGQLGPMPSIQGAFRTHAGENIKLWCFFQDIEALTESYHSKSALMGNSSKQFFGCADTDTAKIIEGYLGQYLDTRAAPSGRGDGEPPIYESSKSLLDTTQIMGLISKKFKNQIVVTSDNDKLELRRETCFPSSNVNFRRSGYNSGF